MTEFEMYYTQRFASDLAKYYDIDTSCSIWPYPFVLTMSSPQIDSTGRIVGTNRHRSELSFGGLRHFSMFAAAVFYTSACAQVLGRLYGRKVMDDFHKVSSWPMLNCGMGGLMSPITVMEDSHLFPHSCDVEAFVEVFNEASRYLEAHFLNFIENNSAIDINAVRDELARQRDLFVAWVKDHRTHYESHYVPVEMMKDR